MTVLFCGGGSGGHIFPAVATMKLLSERGEECTFVTDHAFNKWNNQRSDVSVEYLVIRKSSLLVFVWSLIISIFQSIFLIRKHKPKAVVCFGGYTTVPILITALIFRIPIVLHESNAVLGVVNNLFLPFAKKLACSFESLVESIDAKYQAKVALVGTPITEDVYYSEYKSIDDNINILILGGSQGASIFTNIVPQAIKLCADKIGKAVYVSHQCPVVDVRRLTRSYDDLHLSAEVSSFFDDVSNKISESHIIISRAGASSISEILEIGRPAIYIPYPYAKGDHQKINADAVVGGGGGVIIEQKDFTIESLAECLSERLENKGELEAMAKSAHDMSIGNTTSRFCDLISYIISA